MPARKTANPLDSKISRYLATQPSRSGGKPLALATLGGAAGEQDQVAQHGRTVGQDHVAQTGRTAAPTNGSEIEAGNAMQW